jgi:outer membrane protein OmpA-like peptidoglycan-associated protein
VSNTLLSLKVSACVALLLAVTACASTKTKPACNDSWDGQTLYSSAQTMNAAPGANAAVTGMALPATPSASTLPDTGDRGYDAMASAQSNGSVQIFPLDGPAPAMDTSAPAMDAMASTSGMDMTPMPGTGNAMAMTGAPVPPVTSEPQGIAYGNNADVEVFPFDGQLVPGMTPPMAMAGNAQPGMANATLDSWIAAQGEASRIYFANGSAALSVSGRQILQQVAANAGPGKLISVEAHASKRAKAKDPVERRIINLRMSMERAERVSDALIRKGVPADSIKTTALGDTQDPRMVPAGMSKEAASRRVDIVMPTAQPGSISSP